MICIIYQDLSPDSILLFLICVIKRYINQQQKKVPLYKHQPSSANSTCQQSVFPNFSVHSLMVTSHLVAKVG